MALTTDLWNDVIVGAAIVFLARETDQQTMSTDGAGLNLLLGVWLIIAPFVFGVRGILLWNDIIVGVIIISLAGYNMDIASSTEQPRTTAEQPMECSSKEYNPHFDDRRGRA